MRHHHLHTKCQRSYCYLEHPYGRDIDRVPRRKNNTTTINIELIEMIDEMSSKAEEQQEKFERTAISVDH